MSGKCGGTLHDEEPGEKAPVAAGVFARGRLVFGHALTSVLRLPFQTQHIELVVALTLCLVELFLIVFFVILLVVGTGD
jgi:hypothetical protein